MLYYPVAIAVYIVPLLQTITFVKCFVFCSERESYQVVWEIRPHKGGGDHCPAREASFFPEASSHDQTSSGQEHQRKWIHVSLCETKTVCIYWIMKWSDFVWTMHWSTLNPLLSKHLGTWGCPYLRNPITFFFSKHKYSPLLLATLSRLLCNSLELITGSHCHGW